MVNLFKRFKRIGLYHVILYTSAFSFIASMILRAKDILTLPVQEAVIALSTLSLAFISHRIFIGKFKYESDDILYAINRFCLLFAIVGIGVWIHAASEWAVDTTIAIGGVLGLACLGARFLKNLAIKNAAFALQALYLFITNLLSESPHYSATALTTLGLSFLFYQGIQLQRQKDAESRQS